MFVYFFLQISFIHSFEGNKKTYRFLDSRFFGYGISVIWFLFSLRLCYIIVFVIVIDCVIFVLLSRWYRFFFFIYFLFMYSRINNLNEIWCIFFLLLLLLWFVNLFALLFVTFLSFWFLFFCLNRVYIRNIHIHIKYIIIYMQIFHKMQI